MEYQEKEMEKNASQEGTGAALFRKCANYRVARDIMASGYYPYFKPISSGLDTEVVINGRRLIMIGSNNYLGLTSDPRVKEAAAKAAQKYGSGCTGSRFLNGTLDLHEELEAQLARFMKREAALVFSTGMQTNLGTISALAGKDDVILIDRQDHASIVDGCRLSFAQVLKFRHNDLVELESMLKSCKEEGKLVIVDGVYSMEGDLADLPGIVPLVKKYGAALMVDEAHGLGVLGEHGRGAVEHFAVEEHTDIVMGTFSKSFASIGGFIAAKEEIIHFVKHHARALIFSAAPPPAAVAAVIECIRIIESEPERRIRLRQISERMRAEYRRMGFDTGQSQSPIIPLLIGDDLLTFKMWKELFENGVFVNPAVSPAVPPGRALLRTSYMATHSDEQLDRVLEIVEKAGKKLGLLR